MLVVRCSCDRGVFMTRPLRRTRYHSGALAPTSKGMLIPDKVSDHNPASDTLAQMDADAAPNGRALRARPIQGLRLLLAIVLTASIDGYHIDTT